MNVMMLNGNLTADAVAYHPGTERAAVRFRMACSRKTAGAEGSVDFFNVVAFGKLAERASGLRKGDSAMVVGKCHNVTYQNQAGEAVRRIELYADEIHPANSGAGVNCFSLAGNIVKDPEIRYTAGEKPLAVVRTRICVFRPSASKEGNNDFFDIEAFGSVAENAEKYLKKGDQVFVQGRLTEYEWQDEEGKKHHSSKVTGCRITYLGKRKDDGDCLQKDEATIASCGGFVSVPEEFGGEDFPFH